MNTNLGISGALLPCVYVDTKLAERYMRQITLSQDQSLTYEQKQSIQ
jgi:hypothetical protein